MTATMTKERPILFSGPMVRAILDGRKTQTRRAIDLRRQPEYRTPMRQPSWAEPHESCWMDESDPVRGGYVIRRCPFCRVGDRLWVRETWRHGFPPTQFVYRADTEATPDGWKPSIHMPRSASRITLEITGVRVERLQEISEEDALAEGVRELTKDGSLYKYAIYDKRDMSSVPWTDMPSNPIDALRTYWDMLNAKRAPWASNPWVWVIEFRRIML